jgi:hypothetical protein
MAQDSDQLRALVNTVLNLRVPWNAGKFLSGCPIKQLSFLGNNHLADNGATSITRQQILNKQEQKAATRERLGKHYPAATDTHAIEERCFLRGSSWDIIRKEECKNLIKPAWRMFGILPQ